MGERSDQIEREIVTERGQLGRNLRLSVSAAMHSADEVAFVAPGAALKEVIIAMTRRPMGGACVVAEDGALAGFLCSDHAKTITGVPLSIDGGWVAQ